MNPIFSSAMINSSLVFNRLLLEKKPVTLILDRGEKLSGQLTGWDEHFLLLVSGSKLQVVPSWRLLWLESELENNFPPDPNDGESEKVAAINSDPAKTRPNIPEHISAVSIPSDIAAGSPESPIDYPDGNRQDIPLPVQESDPVPQENDQKSPLDHLEQLVKNW